MRYKLLAAMLFGLMLSACSHWPNWLPGHAQGVSAATAQRAEQSLYGSQWEAEEIEGTATDSAVRTTFNVATDGKVSGRGGCNSYFATANIAGGGVQISGLGATKMACLPPLMTQETNFFDALHRVRGFVIDDSDGKLKLSDAAGGVIVVLRRS